MDYRRSPYRQKDSNYDIVLTPKKATNRKYDNITHDKQNSHAYQLGFNRKIQSSHKNTFLQGNSKHITSQMINECDNQFNEKPEKPYKRQLDFDPDHDLHSKSTFQDNKKFNAKHFEIESKLNKIQSFHQKIQTLLDIVNQKPKTPSKNGENPTILTPHKTPSHQQSSRSVAKISSLKLRQKFELQNNQIETISKDSCDYKQGRQYGQVNKNSSNYTNLYNKNISDQFEQVSAKQYDEANWNNQRLTSKFNDGSTAKRSVNQFQRQSKYFIREKSPLIRASEEFRESNRKKSNQYMKSIEGEVRDIQNTIELLNKKIKQVDKASPFKKQIAFDNLSASNLESHSDNQDRVTSQIQKMYKASASRTPLRAHTGTGTKISHPTDSFQKKETETKKQGFSYRNERSVRNISVNGTRTPSKRDYQLYLNNHNCQESSSKKDVPKMSNPYDGDVEQSEERSKYRMVHN